MGPPPRSFAADAHECIMVRVLDPPDTRSWRDCDPRPGSGLPSDRHPDRTKRAVVLEAVKVWPGKGGIRRKVGRRPTLTAPARVGFAILRVGAKKRNSGRTKKPIKTICPALKLLDKNAHTRGACIDAPGYDAGKKIKGKKRHVLVDTLGLLLHAVVHPANVQDRDGAILVMATLFGMFPFLQKLFADGGYQGPEFSTALAEVRPHLNVEIVKRSDRAKGFVVLSKRWIVERTLAWLNRCRRLAKDWENRNRKALAFLHLASIRLMLRKLCNPA